MSKYILCLKRRKRWLYCFAVLFISICVIVARRPDIIPNPQFFAEDGARWYADAYNHATSPLKPYFMPDAGYLQTLSRLTASIAMFFPLEYGPLVFNIVSILVQLVPIIVILCDRRADSLFANLFHKSIFVFVYLFIPNTSEVHGNITNAHWYLAFASLITILKSASDSRLVNLLNVILVTLSCLSGPFALFLIPIAIMKKYIDKENSTAVRWVAICAFTSVIQLIFLFTSGFSRLRQLPSFSLSELFTIINKQVIWGAIGGPFGIDWISTKTHYAEYIFFITTVLCLGLWVYAYLRGPRTVRYITLYAIAIFLVSIVLPTAHPIGSTSLWTTLANTNGIRYWLIPMIAFLYMVTSVIWSKQLINVAKLFSLSLLSIMVFIIIRYARDGRGIHYPAYPDFKYRSYVNKFVSDVNLKMITIPIVPNGWYMTLYRQE